LQEQSIALTFFNYVNIFNDCQIDKLGIMVLRVISVAKLLDEIFYQYRVFGKYKERKD